MCAKTDELHALVERLPHERLEEAKRLLDSLIPDSSPTQDDEGTVEERAHRLLVKRGLILESGSEEPWTEADKFERIKIRGEPLSKTVIDERR